MKSWRNAVLQTPCFEISTYRGFINCFNPFSACLIISIPLYLPLSPFSYHLPTLFPDFLWLSELDHRRCWSLLLSFSPSVKCSFQFWWQIRSTIVCLSFASSQQEIFFEYPRFTNCYGKASKKSMPWHRKTWLFDSELMGNIFYLNWTIFEIPKYLL